MHWPGCREISSLMHSRQKNDFTHLYMARSTTILNVHTLNQQCPFKHSILATLFCSHVQNMCALNIVCNSKRLESLVNVHKKDLCFTALVKKARCIIFIKCSNCYKKHVCIYTYTPIPYVYVFICICICVYIYIYAQICIYVFVCPCIWRYIYYICIYLQKATQQQLLTISSYPVVGGNGTKR